MMRGIPVLVLLGVLSSLPAWAQQEGLLPSQQPFDSNGMSAGLADNPNQASGQLPSAIEPIITAPTGNGSVDPNITMVAPTQMQAESNQGAAAPVVNVVQQMPEALQQRLRAQQSKVRLYAAELNPATRGSDSKLTLSVTGGAEPDRLQAAYSAWARSVEAAGPLELQAREPVFGVAMTLRALKRDVRPGQLVPVTLVFEHSGPVRAVASVSSQPAATSAVPVLPGDTSPAQETATDPVAEKDRGQPAPPPATNPTANQTIE